MLLLELLVLIVVAAFVANGIKAGAIETLGRFLGAILGFLAARAWSAYPIGALALFMPLSWAWLFSFIAIFLAVDSAVGFVFKIAENFFKILTRLPIIKQIDGIIGGVLGLLESIIVIGGVAYLLRAASLDTVTAMSIITLKSIGVIEKIFTTLLGFLL